MKKFAIGCLIVVAVLVVVGGILGYFFVWKPASVYVASLRALGQLPAIEKQVTNTASFTAPANGELTEELVGRFVKVQEAMEKSLGPTFSQLKTKYDALEQVRKSENRQATAMEGLTALKDLSSIIVQGKHAQVEALNANHFSVAEYNWARSQVYAAATIPLAQLDVTNIAEAARTGGDIVKAPPAASEIPARNKELVAPYAEKLKEWAALPTPSTVCWGSRRSRSTGAGSLCL
jgi:hypothetical protein